MSRIRTDEEELRADVAVIGGGGVDMAAAIAVRERETKTPPNIYLNGLFSNIMQRRFS